jgi:predicted RNA-binding protein with PUA-like domain
MSKINVVFELYGFNKKGLDDDYIQIPAQLKELPRIGDDLDFMHSISEQNGITGTYSVVEISRSYGLDESHKKKYGKEDVYTDHAHLLTVFVKAVVRNADSVPKLDSCNEKFRISY